jgi:hypothetical protein
MRLQAVAEELAAIAQADEGSGEWRGGRRFAQAIDDLIDEVLEALRNADSVLADEFERVVIDITAPPLSLAVRAAVLRGWLEGAVEAETLEVRIRVGESRPRSRDVASRAAVAG